MSHELLKPIKRIAAILGVVECQLIRAKLDEVVETAVWLGSLSAPWLFSVAALAKSEAYCESSTQSSPFVAEKSEVAAIEQFDKGTPSIMYQWSKLVLRSFCNQVESSEIRETQQFPVSVCFPGIPNWYPQVERWSIFESQELSKYSIGEFDYRPIANMSNWTS